LDYLCLRKAIGKGGMDKYTKQQRRKMMASVGSRNTRIETLVRRYLWRLGFRYRLNDRRLPGSPDIVLPKYKTCIMINGCFWHGHDCGAFKMPKENSEFWTTKIERNRLRDMRVRKELEDLGFHVLTVWECELTKNRFEVTLRNLAIAIVGGFSGEIGVAWEEEEENANLSFAAEDDPIQ